MTRLIALYPAGWRRRYEDEFLALLAERPPDLAGRVDIVRGAIGERMHPQVPGSPKAPVEAPSIGRWSTVAGWTTLLGAGLFYLGIAVWASGPIVVTDTDTYRDGSAALPLIFLAMVGLVVGMVAVVLTIPPSRSANSAAYISSLAGLLWGGAPWLWWAGLIAFGGVIVIGGAAWRAGAWSAWRFAALVACIVSAWGLAYLALSGMVAAPEGLQFVLFGIVGLAWPLVGTSLVWPRRFQTPARIGTR
jgi:hypothetical protein